MKDLKKPPGFQRLPVGLEWQNWMQPLRSFTAGPRRAMADYAECTRCSLGRITLNHAHGMAASSTMPA